MKIYHGEDREKNFSQQSIEFIEHTKDFADPEKGYENFRKLFNELAANQDSKTYQHPGWDYSGTEESA